MLPTPYRFHTAATTGGIAFGLLRVLLLLLLLLLALLLLPVTPARAQHASDDPVASATDAFGLSRLLTAYCSATSKNVPSPEVPPAPVDP